LVSTRVSSLHGDFQQAVTDVLNPVRRATPGSAARPQRPPAASPGATPAPSPAIDAAGARSVLTGQSCTALSATVLGRLATQLAARTAVISGRSVSAVVYNRQLTPIGYSTGDPATFPRVSSASIDRALGGEQSASEVIDDPSGSQLAVAFPVHLVATSQQPACLAAQVGTPMAPIDDVLSTDRDAVLLGGGAVLLLALLAGLWLTERTLGPLHRVTHTAGQLAAGDLRARSRLPDRSDEVGTLARAFDDMADRIEIAFAAQAESEARTRRFIADASHELRTPVTALKGYIDVLRRGVSRDPESLEAALSAMARESERMRVLVLDLLTLARIDAHPPLSPERLDLNEVLAGVLDEGVPGMPGELERQFAAQPVMVTADRGSVVTVARNLLVNACKYAPGARQVWSTEAQDGQARFSVLDAGPGISAADLPHLFERFYRGEKTRAREEGGSGLGLSIVQGLVHAQGGEVSIESEETRWTRVTVQLPVSAG
jgi:two-component system OmpR family sensor kinase